MHWNLKHILLSLIFLAAATSAKAQDTLHFDSIPAIQTFALDGKGHYFLADEDHTIYKYSKEGKELSRVNAKSYGAVYSIDCSNPFEIYVFHKDQQLIAFYDNMLNLRGTLNFNNLGYSNISAIARSFDNNIWLFDQSSFELLKLDKEGNRILGSGNLAAFTDAELSPYALLESDQHLYLSDSVTGVIAFDLFGTYSSVYHSTGSHCFTSFNKVLYTLKGSSILSISTETMDMFNINLAFAPEELRTDMQKLFVRKGNSIIQLGG